jgi:fluoroquinolone resistance protein
MADRIHGRQPRATETEIRDADWDGEDLSGQRHERVAFSAVDMTEVTDHGAAFSECTFRDCRFNSSAHVDAAFVNCIFTLCTFFDAKFTRCKLVGTVFDGCTFELLEALEGDWSFVGLAHADLRGASFSGTRMREVDLTGARCRGTKFRDVDMSGGITHGADLTGADLRGSALPSLDPASGQLAGAVIDPDQAMVIATLLGLEVRPQSDPP